MPARLELRPPFTRPRRQSATSAREGDVAAAVALLPALADQHEAATRAIRALGTGS